MRRIIARIDQLMSLCDELEARLAQADSVKLMEGGRGAAADGVRVGESIWIRLYREHIGAVNLMFLR